MGRQGIYAGGDSGIIYDFLIYQGSTTCLNVEEKKEFGLTGAPVVHFTSRMPNGLGYKMFFDNFFTSLPVIRELDEKKVYAAGTIRINRTQTCPLKSEKELKKEGRGSHDSLVSSDETIVMTRRLDNQAVNMASNFLAIEEEDCVSWWSKADGTFIEVKRPAIVREYSIIKAWEELTRQTSLFHSTGPTLLQENGPYASLHTL